MAVIKWAIAILLMFLVFQNAVQAQSSPAWNTSLIDEQGNDGSVALDSNGNPHVAYTHWEYDHDSFGRTITTSSLYYANWTSNGWDIQTVDSSGSAGVLKLDSNDLPHIVFDTGFYYDTLKYAVKNGATWNVQTIATSDKYMTYSLALDQSGHPHIVYTSYNDSENNGYSYDTQDIKYAYFNGDNWLIQKIDTVNFSVGFNELSIAIDSEDKPQVIYLENVEYHFPSNAVGGYSPLDTYNVKYAYLSGGQWSSQTVFTNTTNPGNLVLDSNDQPSLCYSHDIYSYYSPNNSYSANSTLTCGFLNGNTWVTRPVYSGNSQSGKSLLELDSSGNPTVYFFEGDLQNSENSSILYAHWVGTSWDFLELGFPNNYTSYLTSESLDLILNSRALPVLVFSEPVGSIQAATVWGNLTYATLTAMPTAYSPFNNLMIWQIIGVAIILVAVVAFVLIVFKRKTFITEFLT